MSLATRLSELMKEKNVSVTKLKEIAGVSYEMARRYTLGTAEPRTDKLIKIAEFLGTTPSYLQFGTDADIDALINSNDVDIIEGKDYSDTHVQIELYDVKLSAGNGKGCTIEWIPRKSDEPLLFRQAWFKHKNITPASCKAMYVRGQSMYPVLKDWDTVIVNIHDTEIIDGEIYALIYKGHFYIKQVVRSGDSIELISFNPDPQYKPIIIDESQLPDLRIIGRQIWRGG
ncbi:XRE family transcriptional regulator [Gallibacterium anatis]|uniref:XRE family transcriptional regulator n=1 Tax=Gallibacterium anatis TaxID=750 RepID=UPI00254B7F22|nr:LexA family transcriptional regulator [Gallibacterium anatis]WIM82217.1 LexA family transcriptional regulator [Gallibacterium anatis]WIM82290.1 LexA family transcriptional regulator [Gallibacterium anatis]